MNKKNSVIQIKFLDLHAGYLELKAELDQAYHQVMDGGHYILGSHVKDFESSFAKYCEVPYALGISNGLDALKLILKALDISSGDEVLVPSNTFIATWLAVSDVGATPVAVDPDPRTHNINPELVRQRLTKKTKAIMPVHLYGAPAEMDPLREIAHAEGLALIEDAAQAQGATYKGKKSGGLGIAAGFSFYPAKNLGAFGDAGAITTTDANIYDKILYLRNYGSKVKYQHEIAGYNCRLDELQAAFLNVKLKSLDTWNERRKKIVSIYTSSLPREFVKMPKYPNYIQSAWHLFVIETEKRDALRDYLYSRGIESVIHYPTPPGLQSIYVEREDSASAYDAHKRILSLPLGPHLTEEQAHIVSAAIGDFYR